jgi:hypothetical protein
MKKKNLTIHLGLAVAHSYRAHWAKLTARPMANPGQRALPAHAQRAITMRGHGQSGHGGLRLNDCEGLE